METEKTVNEQAGCAECTRELAESTARDEVRYLTMQTLVLGLLERDFTLARLTERLAWLRSQIDQDFPALNEERLAGNRLSGIGQICFQLLVGVEAAIQYRASVTAEPEDEPSVDLPPRQIEYGPLRQAPEVAAGEHVSSGETAKPFTAVRYVTQSDHRAVSGKIVPVGTECTIARVWEKNIDGDLRPVLGLDELHTGSSRLLISLPDDWVWLGPEWCVPTVERVLGIPA